MSRGWSTAPRWRMQRIPRLREERPRRRSRLRIAAGFVAAAAVAVAVIELWYPIHQRFVPKQFGVVEPGRIYRSGQISAPIIRATLERYDIQTVVSLQDYDANDAKHRAEREATEALGIRELHFPLRGDGSGAIHSYASALAEMARADRDGAAVLVHCAAGTERTGATVAFYRILVQGRPASEAYQRTAGRRLGSKRQPAAARLHERTHGRVGPTARPEARHRSRSRSAARDGPVAAAVLATNATTPRRSRRASSTATRSSCTRAP